MSETRDPVCVPETESDLKSRNDRNDISLIKEVKKGNGDAFGILAERYDYIIAYHISKLYSSFKFAALRSGAEKEDLFQECRIVLYKAAKHYDCMRDAKFSTYASACIRNYLVSLRRKYGGSGKHAGYDCVPMDELRENETGRGDRYFAFSDLRSFLETLFGALTEFEKKVFLMYIENKSYKYMAEKLNKNVKSIDNAVCRIKAKLKPYADYFVSEY